MGDPPTPTEPAWHVAHRLSSAAADDPWVTLGRAAGLADARAEVIAPPAPLPPLDVVRLEGPGGRREHWFVRDDGRPARLPDLAQRLGPEDTRDLAPWGGGESTAWAPDDWPAAWAAAARGEDVLAVAAVAGVEPAALARAAATLLAEAARAAPPPGDAKKRAASAAVSAALDGVAAWRAGGAAGPLRAASDAVWRAGDGAGEGGWWSLRGAAEALLWLAQAEGRGADPQGADVVRRAREVGRLSRCAFPGAAEGRAQAEVVRAALPLAEVLLAATDAGRARAAADATIEMHLARCLAFGATVRVLHGDPATGEADPGVAEARGVVVRVAGGWALSPGDQPVEPARVVRLWSEREARALYEHDRRLPSAPTFDELADVWRRGMLDSVAAMVARLARREGGP